MKVIVSPGVITALQDAGDVFRLSKLFSYAHEGRHLVLFQDRGELDALLQTFDPLHRDAYQRAAEASARAAATAAAGASTVIVMTGNSRQWDVPIARLDIDAALELLDEPLAVVVENAANDWHFLLKVVGAAKRAEIEKHAAKNWVVPVHGGGADLQKRLADRRGTEARRLRTFVLFDSDRRHPDELDDNWEPGPNEQCAGFHYQRAANAGFAGRYWMLKRRSIESYLPRTELAAASANDVVDAFFRLSAEGRWFFNMKDGFAGDTPLENAHRCKALYSAVPAADRVTLKSGFGRKLANRYAVASPGELSWDVEAAEEARVGAETLFALI